MITTLSYTFTWRDGSPIPGFGTKMWEQVNNTTHSLAIFINSSLPFPYISPPSGRNLGEEGNDRGKDVVVERVVSKRCQSFTLIHCVVIDHNKKMAIGYFDYTRRARLKIYTSKKRK
jgi:hypothetical protein